MAAAAAGAGSGAAAGAGGGAAAYRFNFRGGATEAELEPTLVSDVRSLNAFNPEQLSGFTQIVLTFLADPGKTDLMDLLNGFASKYGVNVRALKNCCRGLLVLFKESLKRTLTPSQLKDDLVHLGLSDTNGESMSKLWRKDLVALSASVSATLMVNNLVDMEWKFGVSAASNELREIGSTFLQLKLVIDKGTGGESAREDVHMELSLPQFYDFLAQMEKAKTYMDFLAESA